MKRSEALQRLRAQREQLRQQFGVASLAIFGSTARDEATPESDVDLLVEFDRPTGLFDLIRLQWHWTDFLSGQSGHVGSVVDAVHLAVSALQRPPFTADFEFLTKSRYDRGILNPILVTEEFLYDCPVAATPSPTRDPHRWRTRLRAWSLDCD